MKNLLLYTLLLLLPFFMNAQDNPLSTKNKKAIKEYNEGVIDKDEFFRRLIEFARNLKEEDSRKIREGLTEEELRIPLLVRAGSVLPLADGDHLALHVYAPEGKVTQAFPQQLYSDSGDGYGAQRIDTFRVSSKNSSLVIDWQSEGEFPLPYAAVEVFLHGFEAQRAQIDGLTLNVVQEEPIKTQGFQRLSYM